MATTQKKQLLQHCSLHLQYPAQVKALEAQLYSAEARSAAAVAAGAAAVEKAAAGEALIVSMGVRLKGAQAEADPLRAQLTELADLLDSKV